MPSGLKRRLIAEEWLSFREQVVAPNASSVQLQEMRRAFYGGASALYFAVIRGLTPGPGVEPADLKMMSDFDDELADFAARARRGEA